MAEPKSEHEILLTNNVKALAQGLKEMVKKNQENTETIQLLQRTVTEVTQKVQTLEQRVNVLTAQAHGTGPTAG